MPNIIIFGANGQDGYYLSELYRRRGFEVFGYSRRAPSLVCDIGQSEQVEEIIREHKPDIIFHLAADSTTRHGALFDNHRTIGSGTINVLDAVYRLHPRCKVFLTGSGLQFVNTGAPIHESDPFDARNAYAVERIYSTYAARYFRTLGIQVYVGYLFHHESPLRKPNHVSQMIAQAVKRIASGSTELLKIGDMSVEKEWAFAGDIAAGIAAIVEQDTIFEAVIGTGKGYTIEAWLDLCFGFIDKDWKQYVVIQDGFSPEYSRLVSNPQTMRSLGWNTELDIHDLAKLMMSQIIL